MLFVGLKEGAEKGECFAGKRFQCDVGKFLLEVELEVNVNKTLELNGRKRYLCCYARNNLKIF